MTVKLSIRESYRNIPIEIDADLSDVDAMSLVDVAAIMDKLRQVIDGWIPILEKRKRRIYRKWREPMPLYPMRFAKKFLFA